MNSSPGEPGARQPATVRFRRRLVVIVLVAITLRALYAALLAPWPPPVGDDALYHHQAAILLAHGHGFIDPGYARLGVIRPTAAHPPLYPIVLGVVAKFGGTGQVTQRLMGSLLGAATIVLVALIARRMAGDRAGLLAASLGAVYPILITADGALMSETLYGLLVALCLVLVLLVLEDPSPRRGITLGLALGLAALTRGESLMLIPLLLIPLLRRQRSRRVATLAAGIALLVLAPWFVRNWMTFHRPLIVSTDLASAIAGANCPSTFYGSKLGSWDNRCVSHYSGNEAVGYGRAEQDGLRYLRRHVSRLPVVIAARLARVWGLRRNLLPGSRLPQLPDRASVMLELGFLMYFCLLALGAYGVVVLKRTKRPVWPLISTFVLVTITAILVYGDVRFREPAEISLVVLAAVAIDQLWAKRTAGGNEQQLGIR